MKRMIISLFLLVLSRSLLASPIKLFEQSHTVNESLILEKQLNELKKQNKALDKLLKTKKVYKKHKAILPTLHFKTKRIQMGSALKGTLLNSIRSTNLESPILVRIETRKLKGAKVVCSGVTTHKRVQTICTKLILKDREIGVSVQLLNLDGSSGLVGEYNDKQEEMIEGAILDSTSQGVLSALSDRVATPFGDSLSRTLKNQLIQGSISGLEASKGIALANNSNTLEPIVKIKSGTSVLIFFKETLNDY